MKWTRCTAPEASRYRIETISGHEAIVFAPCGVTSFLPSDIKEGYCAVCHSWIKPAEGDR